MSLPASVLRHTTRAMPMERALWFNEHTCCKRRLALSITAQARSRLTQGAGEADACAGKSLTQTHA